MNVLKEIYLAALLSGITQLFFSFLVVLEMVKALARYEVILKLCSKHDTKMPMYQILYTALIKKLE